MRQIPEAVSEGEIIEDDLMDEKTRIRGTRVRVSDIAVEHDYHGLSPEEIVEEYPVSLEQVYAALSHYRKHPEKIREEIQEREKKLRE